MNDSGHYYTKDAKPCYEVPRAKGGGFRKTNISDCRKLGLLPSVTTVLNVLAKPALVQWLCRNAAMAVATTPRVENEPLDQFVERCLSVDAISESDKAKDLGTKVHDAIEKAINGESYPDEFKVYVDPVFAEVNKLGCVKATEKIVVNGCYGGKIDCILENEDVITVVDFKTCKQLPKSNWPEHRMQLGAYAMCLGNTGNKRIECFNIYISTTEPGKISVIKSDNWHEDAAQFLYVCQLWQWMNEYKIPT